MKRQLISLAKSLVLSGALLLPLSSGLAAAVVVYENTTTPSPLGQYYGTNAEFGDQITLDPGTNRTLTDFAFEAYTPDPSTYTLRFYLNNGPLVSGSPSPGTLLTDFTPQTMVVGYQSYAVLTFSLPLPAGTDSLTWTVQFSSPNAGLLLYDPPTIGSSLNDFWQNSGGAWSLAQINNGLTVANFGARLVAVPEPGTIALGALGLLVAAGCRFRRRRQ